MMWVRAMLLIALLSTAAVRDPGGLVSAGVGPRWLLLAALLAGLTASPGRAAAIGWIAGLFVDLFSLGPLGAHAACYGIAALLLARIRAHFFCDHALTQAALGFLFTLLAGLALLVQLELAEPSLDLGARIPGAFAAALATGALLPLLTFLDRRIGLLRGMGGGERAV